MGSPTDQCVRPGSRLESSPPAGSAPRSAWLWSAPITSWWRAARYPTRPVQRAQRRLPDTAVLPVHEVAGRAELLLLAVPDAELATVVSGLGRHARGATGDDRRAHLGRQRHRGAEPADRTGLHPVGDPPGDDLHRCRRGHRPAARHLLRHHRRRRRRLRHCAVAGARDRRRAVPGPRGRPHAVSRGARACQQSHRDRGARRRRGAAVRAVGSGAARAGARRRRAGRHRRTGGRSAGACIAGERAAAGTGGIDRSGCPRRCRRGRRSPAGAGRSGSRTGAGVSGEFVAHRAARTRARRGLRGAGGGGARRDESQAADSSPPASSTSTPPRATSPMSRAHFGRPGDGSCWCRPWAPCTTGT